MLEEPDIGVKTLEKPEVRVRVRVWVRVRVKDIDI